MTDKLLVCAEVDSSAVTNRKIFETPFFEALLTVKEAALKSLNGLGLADEEKCAQVLQAIESLRKSGHGLKHCSLLLSNRALNQAVDDAILAAADGLGFKEQAERHRWLLQRMQTADDVVATAKNLVAAQAIHQVEAAARRMKVSLREKAGQFAQQASIARRRLRDDAETTLGEVFESYAAMFETVEKNIRRSCSGEMVSFMGTDIGLKEPLSESRAFARRVYCELQKQVYEIVCLPENPLAGQGMNSSLIAMHGNVQACAAVFWKLGRDLRLLCSGPRCGFEQISLPALAPGSSIMPGKVNPVILEMAMSTADQVSADHSGLVMGCLTGWLEFGSESIVPTRAFVISCHLLSLTMINVVEQCVDGITANEQRCGEFAELSPV